MIIAGKISEKLLRHHLPIDFNAPFGINVFVINSNWRDKLSLIIYKNVKRIEMNDEKVTLYHDDFMLKFTIKEVHSFITEYAKYKYDHEKADYGEKFFLNYYVDDKEYYFWEPLRLSQKGYEFELLAAEELDDTMVTKIFRKAFEQRTRRRASWVDFNGYEIGVAKTSDSMCESFFTYFTKIIVKTRIKN